MKNIIMVCICLLSLNNCNAQHRKQKNIRQKTTLKNKKINPYQYLITKDFEKINTNTSDKREFLSNGNFMKITCGNYGCYYEELIKNSYYKINKEFYSNSNIQSKGISFNQDTFKMGIWYEFDENGKLIKETNYDDGYDFTLEDVIQYAETQKTFQRYEDQDNTVFPKGEYTILNSENHNKIKKDTLSNGQKLWIIECHEDGYPIERDESMIKDGKIVGNAILLVYTQIVLDGKTGKVLYKKIIGIDEKNPEAYKKVIQFQKSTSFLASPEEKSTYKKPGLGVAYTYGEAFRKGTFQIYDGRAYTKSEWEEFRNPLP